MIGVIAAGCKLSRQPPPTIQQARTCGLLPLNSGHARAALVAALSPPIRTPCA
eukprot:CAMPEP_0179143660 /NCGR_PEP_ID=MMETSP0796-20121207/69126_1 /TAXON_ID=73915 /ORGANISM="Pyrodinium bahamense, Strain pbaha01" /LENGTH=52 /DNA_ID=CAMNT_0020843741 /DNA_START=9 /DNA_END=163 /DNA_ORIENTATION=-